MASIEVIEQPEDDRDLEEYLRIVEHEVYLQEVGVLRRGDGDTAVYDERNDTQKA